MCIFVKKLSLKEKQNGPEIIPRTLFVYNIMYL